MDKKYKAMITWGAILAAIIIAIAFMRYQAELNDHSELAKCITDSGIKLYGAYWCPHCNEQKELFGTGQKFLRGAYVECASPTSPNEQAEACVTANIESYPTWVFPSGERVSKVLSIEELKAMSLQDLAKLVSARERRSITRGFTDAQKKLLKKVEATNQGTYKRAIKTHCRSITILPNMIGLKINIHNGKEYVQIEIQPEMVGHRLGEFAETRKRLKHSAPGIGATKSSAHQSVK